MSNVYHYGCRASQGLEALNALKKLCNINIIVQNKRQCKVYHTLITVEEKIPQS